MGDLVTDLLCSNNRVLWHVGKALLYFQGVLGPPQDEVKAAERVRVLQEEATASLEALIVVSDTLVHPVSQSNWGYSHWYESGVAQEGSSLRYSPSGEGFVNLVRHTQNEGDKEDKFYLCEGKIRTRQYAKDGHKVVAEVQAFYLDRGDGVILLDTFTVDSTYWIGWRGERHRFSDSDSGFVSDKAYGGLVKHFVQGKEKIALVLSYGPTSYSFVLPLERNMKKELRALYNSTKPQRDVA